LQKPEFSPGDYAFDPLGLSTGKDAAWLNDMKLKELNNGEPLKPVPVTGVLLSSLACSTSGTRFSSSSTSALLLLLLLLLLRLLLLLLLRLLLPLLLLLLLLLILLLLLLLLLVLLLLLKASSRSLLSTRDLHPPPTLSFSFLQGAWR